VDVSLLQLGLLFVAATTAGTIDAIAGGGGLITLPALLATGLPPHLALGTNKGQSVFGSFAALLRYHHAGLVSTQRAKIAFPMGLLGSLAGAAAVLLISRETLRPLVLILLISVAIFLVLYRRRDETRPIVPIANPMLLSGIIALVIGSYDGFFGPGTGTFLIAAYVGLLGLTLPQATADAKVVNFASNLAAVAVFSSRGVVIWKIAVPMAVGQFIGGWLGAHIAVKGGAKVIRVVVLAVVIALSAKIAWDLWSG
jgi:uncharacterized membrane protein YfcA